MTDLRAELAELAASVRAYVEWHEDTGGAGLITEGDPEQLLAELDGAMAGAAPLAAAPRTAARGAPAPEPRRPERAPPPTQRSAARAPAPQASTAPSAAPPAPATPLAEDERKTRLALVAEQVRGCSRCELHSTRTNTVFARGNPMAEVCFVGEGPGADEDRQGYPFVGKAGQLLDRMITAMGYAPDEVYICNIVKCRPPNNRKPEVSEMDACIPYLHQQLETVQPKVMVALGATAVQGLLGTTEGITRLRGKWKLYRGITPMMPTFHPAYLLRQPGAKREVWSDLQQVLKQLGRTAPKRKR